MIKQGKHSLKDWIIAVRPWSFTASIFPVIVSYAALLFMGYEPKLGVTIWLLLNIVALHAGGNVWSDCNDFLHGVDTTETAGATTLTSGLFTEKTLRRLSLIILFFCAISGLLMAILIDTQLLWIGLTGSLLLFIYPWMKYHMLGDINILLCYGVLPTLAVSIGATGTYVFKTLYYVMPVALITLSILHGNNMRDMESDRHSGIHTLCISIGKTASTILYILEVSIPFVWVLLLDWRAALPTLLTIPLLIRNIRFAILGWRKYDNKQWLLLDQQSAQLQLTFALTFSIGLFIRSLSFLCC